MLRCLTLCACVLGATSVARAEWWVQTPDDLCVDRQLLATRLQEAVSEAVLASAPRRTARVSLDEEVGRIDILMAREGVPFGERVVSLPGATCDELVEATVFVLIALIDGGVGELQETRQVLPTNEGGTQLAPPSNLGGAESERGEPPASDVSPNQLQTTEVQASEAMQSEAARSETTVGLVEPLAPETPARTHPTVDEGRAGPRPGLVGSFTVGADYTSGRLPVGFGPRLALEIGRARWRLRLAGAYRRGAQPAGAGNVAMDDVSGSARACYARVVGAWIIGACAGLDAGQTWARGSGFDIDRRARATSVGIGGDATVEYRTGRFLVRGGLGVVGWMSRGEFTFDRVGVAYAQTPASLRGLLELGVALGDPS